MTRKDTKYNHVILEEDVTPREMTTTQLQVYGRSKIAETDAALMRAKKTVAETNALAADTYEELQNQTSQVRISFNAVSMRSITTGCNLCFRMIEYLTASPSER